MNAVKIGFKSLGYRPLNSFLSILLLGVGLGLIMVLFSAQDRLEKTFTSNIRSIDMVVGAKGSPLQLILSSVYHIDAPTGNIALPEFEQLQKNPLVQSAIPLSYGDNFKGYRIVGTQNSYPELYSAKLAKGAPFSKPFEVCLGASVAQKTGLKLGDTFQGNHGLDQEGDSHDQKSFKVVGIYQGTGQVIDKLILTPLESVWQVHNHEEEEDHAHHDEPREITAGLIQFKSAMATMMLPRMVNEKTNMQAALPAIEINRLFTLTESAVQFIQALGYLMVIIAAISVFTALFQSLRDEEPQLAFLRALGASRLKIFTLILTKGIILSLLGYLLGLLLSQVALSATSRFIESNYQYQFGVQWLQVQNLYLLAGVLALGLLCSLLPAIRAYRLNISNTLAHA